MMKAQCHSTSSKHGLWWRLCIIWWPFSHPAPCASRSQGYLNHPVGMPRIHWSVGWQQKKNYPNASLHGSGLFKHSRVSPYMEYMVITLICCSVNNPPQLNECSHKAVYSPIHSNCLLILLFKPFFALGSWAHSGLVTIDVIELYQLPVRVIKIRNTHGFPGGWPCYLGVYHKTSDFS